MIMTDWQSLRAGSRIFFVGIGGISMSGLAEIAMSDGYIVAGSDRNPGHRTDHLESLGITVFKGHQPGWIDQFAPDLVVHTAAVHWDNPELIRSSELGITVIDRARFLGWINRSFAQVINISGTHGKTTTTAICALIMIEAGIDPTVHLGAELRQFHGTVRTSRQGKVMVSEACEYMNSFLQFYSTTAAVLNIDYDHVDFFSNLDAVIRSFTSFSDLLPDNGILIVPEADPNVAQMLSLLEASRLQNGRPMPRLVTFGIRDEEKLQTAEPDTHSTYVCRNLTYEQAMPRFDLWHDNQLVCHVSLQVPGLHNVLNALAAVACAHENGADFSSVSRVLNSYQGAEGRFTNVGRYRGARVISDYAHHPAAARVTLAAAGLLPHRHLWVVFQPLTFSRTRVLFDEYVAALKDCEQIIFSEIYSDRETNPGDISSRMVADRINELGGQAWFGEDFSQIRTWLDERVHPDDIILVMGPENIRDFADELTGRTSHLDD
ncbi:MAG: UDP-N-acetylmuramate--L-alanine ligase [Bacillota bacterium]|nr:UDP-N-acetylmuramate--L-alanine ligase [Bacillota bacterium]